MYDSVHLTDRYLLQISGNGHLYQYTEFKWKSGHLVHLEIC